MQSMKNMLFAKIGSEASDSYWAGIICYVVSIVILVIGFLKIGKLELTEIQGLLGLLLVFILALQLVIGGLLLEIRAKAFWEHEKKEG